MSSVWTFATVVLAIGAAILYQKPIANILTNIAQKAGQQSTSSTPTPTSSAQQQQQQPSSSGPTNNPDPSASPAPAPSPAPSTPSPTVAKGGTNGFGITHFYADLPTGITWYITSCQTPNGPFEGKVAGGGDITNGCMETDNSKMRWDIWSNPSVCNYHNFNVNPNMTSLENIRVYDFCHRIDKRSASDLSLRWDVYI
jgi:hypothetical protein